MSGSSKTGKKDKTPKGLKLDPSPSTTSPGGHDGTLIIKGKAFGCYVKDFKVLNKLVVTNFGPLYQMIHEPTGHIMTVQIGDVSSTNLRERLLTALNDFKVRKTDCPHIVPIYGAMTKEGKVWICMEPMRAASLYELHRRVYATPDRRMPEEVLREIAIAVIHALDYLHITLRYPHRGVWPSNILMDDKGNFKLCFVPDTNPRKLSSDNDELDIVEYNDIRFEIWRLGMTLIQLATGTLQMMLPGGGPYSDELRDFVAQCGKEYHERPNCALLLEAKQLPFLVRFKNLFCARRLMPEKLFVNCKRLCSRTKLLCKSQDLKLGN